MSPTPENILKLQHMLSNTSSPMSLSDHQRLVSLTKRLASDAKHGRHRQALALFSLMFASPDLLSLDPYVFPLAIKSAAALCLPLAVHAIHAHATKSGVLHSPHVTSSLLGAYGKCSSLAHARQLFDDCSQRNAVVWNAMISHYCRSKDLPSAIHLFELMNVRRTASSFNCIIAALVEFGGGSGPSRAFELCRRMQSDGITPDMVTILALFPACVASGALNLVKEIHGFSVRNRIQPNLQVGSGLVECYGRCGCLSYARSIFDQIDKRDVVLWSSMVSAYAFHGHAKIAMSVFKHMELDQIQPDGIMFLSVLKACSHAGLADDALKYFDIMTESYGMAATGDHYSCLVDVLSRAGRLSEAYEVIRSMPMKATAKAWGALLGACRSYGEVALAEIAGRVLFDIEPENAGNFVLLASVYAGAGKYKEAERVRMLMEKRGVALNPGGSWVVPHTSSDWNH